MGITVDTLMWQDHASVTQCLPCESLQRPHLRLNQGRPCPMPKLADEHTDKMSFFTSGGNECADRQREAKGH